VQNARGACEVPDFAEAVGGDRRRRLINIPATAGRDCTWYVGFLTDKFSALRHYLETDGGFLIGIAPVAVCNCRRHGRDGRLFHREWGSGNACSALIPTLRRPITRFKRRERKQLLQHDTRLKAPGCLEA
jgi:hypothetical protein